MTRMAPAGTAVFWASDRLLFSAAAWRADRPGIVAVSAWPDRVLGAAAAMVYARTHAETAVIIGAVAGLLPTIRAARMSPTEAIWTR